MYQATGPQVQFITAATAPLIPSSATPAHLFLGFEPCAKYKKTINYGIIALRIFQRHPDIYPMYHATQDTAFFVCFDSMVTQARHRRLEGRSSPLRKLAAATPP